MPTESPEVIERQIADKRREMLNKVDDLTSRTTGTVRGAVNSLTDLTGSVGSTVEVVGDTLGRIGKMANPAAVSEVIRDTVGAIPVSDCVRDKPWACVGGAALAGFLTGMVASRIGRTAPAAPSSTPMSAVGPAAAASRPSAFSSLFDQLLDRVGQEVRRVAQNAVDTAGQAISNQIANVGEKFTQGASESSRMPR